MRAPPASSVPVRVEQRKALRAVAQQRRRVCSERARSAAASTLHGLAAGSTRGAGTPSFGDHPRPRRRRPRTSLAERVRRRAAHHGPRARVEVTGTHRRARRSDLAHALRLHELLGAARRRVLGRPSARRRRFMDILGRCAVARGAPASSSTSGRPTRMVFTHTEFTAVMCLGRKQVWRSGRTRVQLPRARRGRRLRARLERKERQARARPVEFTCERRRRRTHQWSPRPLSRGSRLTATPCTAGASTTVRGGGDRWHTLPRALID